MASAGYGARISQNLYEKIYELAKANDVSMLEAGNLLLLEWQTAEKKVEGLKKENEELKRENEELKKIKQEYDQMVKDLQEYETSKRKRK